MKRQEAFDRMRKNRYTALRLQINRHTDQVIAEMRSKEAVWAEQKARAEEFDMQHSLLLQFMCVPMMPPEFYDSINERMERLCNEHGVRASTPKRELKVVGGTQ